MLDAGSRYLYAVGPFYGFFGAGLALYFASQGAGRLLWPLVAAFVRLILAVGGGWLAISWFGGGLPGLFAAIALAIVAYGCPVVLALRAGAWRPSHPAS